MNEVGCQRAVRELLFNYGSVLTDGHVHQGMPRTIREIVISSLSPPTQYYHVKIQVADTAEMSFGGGPGNQAKPERRAIYNCVVHIADSATPSGVAESEPYELVHTDFRNMCNGMAAMLAGAHWQSGGTYAAYFEDLQLCIEDPESDSKFSIVRGGADDRTVAIQNMDLHWAETDDDVWTPMLYSRIKFKLLERMA